MVRFSVWFEPSVLVSTYHRVPRADVLLLAIIKLRQGMWEKVAKRSHVPRQIFTFGGSSEYMLHGSVGYELKDGRKTSTEWAARGQLVQVDGKLKMKFYQVFLVSAFL